MKLREIITIVFWAIGCYAVSCATFQLQSAFDHRDIGKPLASRNVLGARNLLNLRDWSHTEHRNILRRALREGTLQRRTLTEQQVRDKVKRYIAKIDHLTKASPRRSQKHTTTGASGSSAGRASPVSGGEGSKSEVLVGQEEDQQKTRKEIADLEAKGRAKDAKLLKHAADLYDDAYRRAAGETGGKPGQSTGQDSKSGRQSRLQNYHGSSKFSKQGR